LQGRYSQAMSRENVAIVERFAEHWNETGEPLWAELDPEIVFEIDPGSFVAGTYRGYDELRTLIRLTEEVFDEFRLEFDELIDTGEAVVALGRIRVRGVKSGARGTQQGALLFRFRDGRIVLYRSFLRREDALEAAGLRD
jgi:ketosteroid isomerase-like protein